MRSTRARIWFPTAVAAVAAIGLLAGCGQAHDDHRGKGDAPVAGTHGEDSAKAVTNNPDGFGNVVTGCVAGASGWRYFATTNTGSAPSSLVVRKDPACSK